MNVQALLRQINPHGAAENRPDGVWAVWPDLDVRKMARVMVEAQVHLTTLTGVPGPDGALRVIYHWAPGARLVNIETVATGGRIDSIADLAPGADWAEREICDYYAVEFTGRATTAPLVLRDGDPRGLFTLSGEAGREANPATSAREAVKDERGETR